MPATRCCIAGGGPAGMMLGLLLARAGIDVIVLEKHEDFLRDFRGDTIHPSTMEVMHELGLLTDFLKLPYTPTARMGASIGGEYVELADFSHLPVQCKFIAMMPQWEFLNFLAEAGRAYPSFHLMMRAEAMGLNGQTVTVRTPDGEITIDAELVIGADGRASTLRDAAGFTPIDLGAPMDVLWMRLPRHAGDPSTSMGRISTGRFMAMLDRGDYWQCAYVIPKGGIEAARAAGLPAFRAAVADLMPLFSDRTEDIKTWDDVKLLTVAVNHLPEWSRPGLLFIGDAAHAMSPIGGVGVNYAVQDAVAAANILIPRMKTRALTHEDLRDVQRRREPPTRRMQRLQVFLQNNLIAGVLAARGPLKLPLPVRLLRWFPLLRRIPARVIGLGFQPEHINH